MFFKNTPVIKPAVVIPVYNGERIVFDTVKYSTSDQYKYSLAKKELGDFMKNVKFILREKSVKSNDETHINSCFKNMAT